jgi:hypothetical protein
MIRLVFAIILLFCLCGGSQAWKGDPTQEWIYVFVESKSFNGRNQLILMTKAGGVTFREDLDLATVTYKFKHVPDRSKFNLLKECFGMATITPAQIGNLFGVPCKIAYAYVWNTGPIVHTVQEFLSAFMAGLIKQNSVTLNIVE